MIVLECYLASFRVWVVAKGVFSCALPLLFVEAGFQTVAGMLSVHKEHKLLCVRLGVLSPVSLLTAGQYGKLPVIGGAPASVTCLSTPSAALHTFPLLLLSVCLCVQREGNVLMSFNNRPATDSIPFLSPFLAPSARAVGPLLDQLATSPFRAGLENVSDALRGLSPGLVKQLLPIFDQLTPIYMDVAQVGLWRTPWDRA
jgi:hypothetical protein